MATPYFQQCHDIVPSTQNVARDALEELPILVLAKNQTEGRGRTGNHWWNAERALAASLAIHLERTDRRPFSLMAGIAAIRATEGTSLKWPNDVLLAGLKVGGILVERSNEVVVVGIGLNLWWPDAPAGSAALFDQDPGDDRYAEVGALWGAELLRLLDDEGWPIDEYRSICETLDCDVSWEPDNVGRAMDVAADGGLIVERDGKTETVLSGEVRHLRHR